MSSDSAPEGQGLRASKAALRAELSQRMANMTAHERATQSEAVVLRLLSSRAFREARRVSVYMSTPHEVNTDRVVEYILTGALAHEPPMHITYSTPASSPIGGSHTQTAQTALEISLAEKMKQLALPASSTKKCFVPQYGKHLGHRMMMLRLKSIEDFVSLPLTKWNIRQPRASESSTRENALSGLEDLPHSTFYPSQGQEQEQTASSTGPDYSDQGLDLIIVPGLGFTRSGQRLGHGMGYYDDFLGRWRTAMQIQALRMRAMQPSAAASISRFRPLAVGLAFKEQMCEDEGFPVGPRDFRLDAVIYPDCSELDVVEKP